MEKNINKLFFLHIKECAGPLIKKILYTKQLYTYLPQAKNPPTFIQSDQKYWNDILNNRRIYLGNYHNKRSLFAKTFLYKSEWPNLFKFTFVEHPYARIKSCFFYLYKTHDNKKLFLEKTANYSNLKILKNYLISKININYCFDRFLDLVEFSLQNFSNNLKNFRSHIEPFYSDITDDFENVLLDKIYKVEDLEKNLKEIFEIYKVDFDKKILDFRVDNKNKHTLELTKYQIKKIDKIYSKDLECYFKL